MTLEDLGHFLVFIYRVFGECTIHTDERTFKLKDKNGITVGQYGIAYGKVEDVWIRMDKIPEPKKKEVEKALQSGRLDNIVLSNG